MTRIAFVIYRKWAYEIYRNIAQFQKEHPTFSIEALITVPEADFDIEPERKNVSCFVVPGKDNDKIGKILQEKNISVAFFYGWSWIVKEPTLSKYLCLCLHPSPLPKYRGGTPLQHQIMNGETMSAVSVFKMTEGIDDGDIYMQLPMSLAGTLKDIFERMADLGIAITKKFITDFEKGVVKLEPQKGLEENPPLKRRLADYEIDPQKAAEKTFVELHNFVRALGFQYPDPYITVGNKKIIVLEIKKRERINDGTVLEKETAPGTLKKPILLKIRDGYAEITDYKLEK